MSFGDLFRIKKFKVEIENLRVEKLKLMNELAENLQVNDELQTLLLEYKQKVNGYLTDYIESKEINIDSFCTNEYKTQFESFKNNNEVTEKELLDKFNELHNKESIYFDGIFSCIDFIRTKRTRKVSIEKQILKYILTETGRNMVNEISEKIVENNE